MKLTVLLLAALCATVAAEPARRLTLLATIDLDDSSLPASAKWPAWKKAFNKKYDNLSDEAAAMEAFATNDKLITEHNNKGLSYTLGHNEFSDMTQEQFRKGSAHWDSAS